VSGDISLAVVTAVLGLLTAGVLAVVNNWINARAGVDENLRTRRLEQYPALWSATAAVSRWPSAVVSRGSLEDLHRTLRSWYYGQGGLFLSEQARARYGDVQELIAALLTVARGDASDVLAPNGYTDLMETASALRTALTQDLDTRRKKSAWDNRQRLRWHAGAAQAAKVRIARAKPTMDTMLWLQEADGEAHRQESAPGSAGARGSDHELELAKYLWEEYKYRHDLIWRLLFRVTAVAALLSIAPFTIGDLAGSRAGFWVKFLPALAIGLVVASWMVLWVELGLFIPIDRHYVCAQNVAVGDSVRDKGKLGHLFELVVRLYPGLLLILTVIVACIVWFRHTPTHP
jgi:hypothetical protein